MSKKKATQGSYEVQPAKPKQVRTFLVTIIEPAFDAQVGVNFSAVGTCDAPPGTTIQVEFKRSSGTPITKNPVTDEYRTWRADFTSVPMGNNYKLTAQKQGGGSNVDEVTDIDVSDFSIEQPAPGSDVSDECSVCGTCNDLIANPTFQIEVFCTAADDPDEPVVATTSPQGTFVAFFDELDPDVTAVFTAECTNTSATVDPVGDMDVEDPAAPSAEIEEPYNGQEYPSIDPPTFVSSGFTTIYEASGEHKTNRQLFAYVTEKGKLLHAPIPVTDGDPVGGNKVEWKIELYKLFRGKAPVGTYHFHVVGLKADKHKKQHHRSSGKFKVLT